MKYAKVLPQDRNLTLEEIMMLDKVQKKNPLNGSEEKQLRAKPLIEGRRPNYFFGIKVLQKTGQKAAYSKNKAFDKMYYMNLVLKAIKENGTLERGDVDDLLWKKLPDWMNEEQKKNKVKNLLSDLKKQGKIKNLGSFKELKWVLN